MEIKPNILDILVLYRCVNLRHLLSDSVLTSFLIDEIYPILVLVVSLSLLDVFLGRLERLIKVRVGSHWGCPLHVGLHLPQ